MNLVNPTPLQAYAMPGPGPEDRAFLTVVLKGAFEIVPDLPAKPAAEAAPVAFADELVETRSGALPLLDSDLAPFKPRADILLIGKAYAPSGKPCEALDARMRVGRVDKTIRVIGRRLWKGGPLGGEPRPTDPEPFTEQEISYAHAYGGADAARGAVFLENPVGTGFIADKAKRRDVEGRELPRIEDPAHPVKRWNDRPSPAGFGTLGRGWAARARHLGTYDERWNKERAPLPPRDFSFAFHNSAPEDQQVESYLTGDESFQLVQLTPSGRLSGKLPGLKPGVEVRRLRRARAEPVDMKLDTLVLRPDRMLLVIVWRGLCPIPSPENPEVVEIAVALPAA
jgi:hypothetical protein